MTKPLEQLFNEYIFECEYSSKLQPQTLHGYRSVFALLVKIKPDLTPETLTTSVVADFFRILDKRQRIIGKGSVKSGIKRSTVATYRGKLNGFFEWLVSRQYIVENPFKHLAYTTPVYEDRKFLKKLEIEKIVTAIISHSTNNILALKRNLLLFHILLFCGLRKGELLYLQIRDLDLERRLVTIRKETSKSGRSRIVPIHSKILLHLNDYLKERKTYTTPYLFVSSKRDDRLTEHGLKQLITRLQQYSGVHFHLHQFRHTFAVNFLKASNNVAKLKQLLGHTDIRTTLQYLRCLPPNEMRRDIESMSIDSLI